MDGRSPKRRRVSAENNVSSSAADPDTPSRRPRRPSYASPTRASMSRHNPQILERRQQAAQPTYRRGGILAPPDASRAPAERVAASEPGEEEDDGDAEDLVEPQTAAAGPTSRASLQPGSTRSPRPNPRPLPPRGPEEEEESLPFVPRTRTSPRTGVMSRRQAQEPELPPARSDPVSSTPPKGIHSSPSRWRGKSRTPKSSPLKQRPMRAGEETGSPTRRTALSESTQAPRQPALNPRDENAQLDTTADPARKVSTQDPVKLKERQELTSELKQLQSDLALAQRENTRILRMQTSGQTLSFDYDKELLDLLRRCLAPGDILAQPPQSQQLVMAALNPSSFLPFSKPSNAPATNKELEKLSKIKSHHPVVMSTQEELPYLQLFNPFEVTSSIANLPPTAQQAHRQRRLLNLRSRHTPSLFHSRIEMIVNPMTLSIFELNVSALEPAARHELGPFVDKICNGRCNRSMQRNVGILAWAMGEWHRIAIKRAGAWARLEKQLDTKEALIESVTRLRRKRRRDEAEGQAAQPRIKISGADLARLVGKQTFDVTMDTDDANSGQLRLEWKIGFDWTGEAESKLSVLVGVPGKCKFTSTNMSSPTILTIRRASCRSQRKLN